MGRICEDARAQFIESFAIQGVFQLRSRVQCPVVVCVLFSMSFGPFVTVGDVADLDACLLTDPAWYCYLVSIVGEGLELLSLDANIIS
jgi:hypothetical protein